MRVSTRSEQKKATYTAFIEIAGIKKPIITVLPDQVLVASISMTYSTHSVSIKLREKTVGVLYSNSGTYLSSTQPSAQWGVYLASGTLPNFGTIISKGDKATIGGTVRTIGSFESTLIVTQYSMNQSGTQLASTHSLNSKGNSFKVVWIAE